MSLMYDEIMEQPRVLGGIAAANEKVLNDLMAKIKEVQPTQVVIAARGTSDHCGIYFKYLLEMLVGIPVALAAPSVNTVYGAKLKYENAIVIGISQSGMAEDALAVLRDANESGAITVAVTNDMASPMAKEADYTLDCAAGKEKSVAATKTFTAQMYCLALLAAKWSGDAALTQALSVLPAELLKETDKIQAIMKLAKEYTFMSDCIVLGRGLAYPIALEASLKMMETTYTNARGFAVSDFQHGPLALISDNVPVFVYVTDDETSADVLAAVDNYASLGAYIVMITNNVDFTAKADKVFLAEPSSKFTAPFHFVLIAQMFACGLAEAKRRTPDAPRNIKKITITK